VTAITHADGEKVGALDDIPAGATSLRSRRWTVWCGLLFVLIGGLWYGLSRGGGPTVSATVADCSRAFTNQALPATQLRPVVVGLGSVASVAVLDTPTGPGWCFDGMGTGTDGITPAQMRAPIDAPVAVLDGNASSDVLMLVHLGGQTASVVVTTATSRSTVVARGGGFEVLRIATTGWPHWHRPWPHGPVSLGRLIGFDHEGRVTSSQAFTWCPGSINNSPGTGC
jgi:hypothetical protein